MHCLLNPKLIVGRRCNLRKETGIATAIVRKLAFPETPKIGECHPVRGSPQNRTHLLPGAANPLLRD